RQQIAVAVAQKSAGTIALGKEAFVVRFAWRHFQRTNRALHVTEPHVFGPEFWRDRNRQAGRERVLNHLLVDTFGVEINFDATAAARNAIKNAFPKIVASFRNAAFAMNTKRDAVDGRYSFEQRRESVAAVGRVIVRVETFYDVVRVRT